MRSTLESYDIYAIRSILRRINETWLGAPVADFHEAMSDCFTDDVIFNGPDFREVARGKPACIEGYAEFAGTAENPRIHARRARRQLLRRYCNRNISVEAYLPARRAYLPETGYDVFVFVRRKGRWLATWRAMVPQAGAP